MNDLLIISRPDFVPRWLRIMYGIATALIWYGWLYLWLPLVTLVAWSVGGLLGYHQMIELQGYRTLGHIFIWYGLVVVVTAGGLLLWASYNLLRFRGMERRGPLPDYKIETYANHIRVLPAELAMWCTAKVITVNHHANGEFHSAEIRGVG